MCIVARGGNRAVYTRTPFGLSTASAYIRAAGRLGAEGRSKTATAREAAESEKHAKLAIGVLGRDKYNMREPRQKPH